MLTLAALHTLMAALPLKSRSFARVSIRQPEGRLRWTCDVDTDRTRLGKAHLRKLEELTDLFLLAHLLLHLHHVLLLLLLLVLLLL